MDFVVVYLEEAHPTDGWMYGAVRHKISQHTSMEERRAAACIMQNELNTIFKARGVGNFGEPHAPPPLVIDQMENVCSHSFGALPERLAILDKGRLIFLGGKGPEDYSVDACRRALGRLLG